MKKLIRFIEFFVKYLVYKNKSSAYSTTRKMNIEEIKQLRQRLSLS